MISIYYARSFEEAAYKFKSFERNGEFFIFNIEIILFRHIFFLEFLVESFLKLLNLFYIWTVSFRNRSVHKIKISLIQKIEKIGPCNKT